MNLGRDDRLEIISVTKTECMSDFNLQMNLQLAECMSDFNLQMNLQLATSHYDITKAFDMIGCKTYSSKANVSSSKAMKEL